MAEEEETGFHFLPAENNPARHNEARRDFLKQSTLLTALALTPASVVKAAEAQLDEKVAAAFEKRQFSSLSATLNSIALLTLMALWLLRVTQTKGEEDIRPTLSATEQQVLQILAGQHLRPGQKQQLRDFSAQWLAVLLGNMGGFMGNPQRQMPG